MQILDDIVPNLVARAEAQEKRARAAAKVAAQLNSVVPDDNGHYGRSRRQRTQVCRLDATRRQAKQGPSRQRVQQLPETSVSVQVMYTTLHNACGVLDIVVLARSMRCQC